MMAWSAIESAGGASAVARAFRLHRSAVYQWASRGVPANRAVALARLAGNGLRASDLRPDVFIEELPQPSGANTMVA